MNKVITINLNGKAYQLEETGFEALHAYLQKARTKLDGNPDQAEIVKDFEQAIAEKCDKYLSHHKNVVSNEEIKTIIKEMGPVTVDSSSEENDSNESEEHVVKRLYRIREGAWIAGVCKGIAVYFGMDVMVVRIIFIVLALFTRGGAIGLYILMAFFVPAADTNEEKAFARGKQFNANEFIEEMKEKYGKYAQEGYWKQYVDKEKYSKYTEKKHGKHHTDTDKKYWTKVSDGWLSFTRVGTGIFSVIGAIVLAGIAIVYSIVMWAILVRHGIFENKFLFGASPALMALFVTACAYVVAWPIKKLVREARLHTWNITGRRHPVRQAFSVVIWLIAIGFVVTVGALSLPDRHKTNEPYGVDFWISHHEVCIGGNYFCNPQAGIDQQNQTAVQQTVTDFAETLKQVSLLAPSAILKPQMQTLYGPFLTPELLKQWQAHPETALGRETSSPYPNAISIDETIKNSDGSYAVTGEVVEITDQPNDGIIDTLPVTLTLIQTDGLWHISAVTKGAYQQVQK